MNSLVWPHATKQGCADEQSCWDMPSLRGFLVIVLIYLCLVDANNEPYL